MTRNVKEIVDEYFKGQNEDTDEIDHEQRLFQIFGLIVSRARNGLMMSQGELADKVGFTRTSITNIEAGKQRLPITKMLKLFKILDEPFVSFIELIEREIEIR